MGRRISKEFLHPSILEGVNNKIGSLDSLETDAKGNMVQAINELVEKLDNSAEIENGKELIANAVGEPLTVEESFDEMSSDINSLLSQFKTNMMNNGITVESSDRFKALIDKIATMVEEGEGKGIQFAEGIETIIVDYTAPLFGGADFREPDTWEPVKQISINVGFKPMYILLVSEEFQFCRYEGTDYSIPQGYFELNNMSYCNINYTEYGGKMVRNKYWYNDGTSDGSEFIFDRRTEINNTGFDLFYRFLHVWSGYAIQDLHANVPLKWIAIGVGEEDTTLRDSLADILENKGVDVTEEDDMASLISKVDSEFENKNNTQFYESDLISDSGKKYPSLTSTGNARTFTISPGFTPKTIIMKAYTLSSKAFMYVISHFHTNSSNYAVKSLQYAQNSSSYTDFYIWIDSFSAESVNCHIAVGDLDGGTSLSTTVYIKIYAIA